MRVTKKDNEEGRSVDGIIDVGWECLDSGKCRVKVMEEVLFIDVKDLRDGDIVIAEDGRRFRVRLKEEEVISLPIRDELSFTLGYIIGNFHSRVMIKERKVYAMAVPTLMERLSEFNAQKVKTKFMPNIELPIPYSVVLDFGQR
ncbi:MULTISPECIES: hypothetical protein [Acidianus]|uniref:Urease accessory protein UreE n=1 Tax=Candidatus Acidianus copahuensis TaxID=1160895 RepID=A0A031LXP9_9CREN|nr:MULTISPECIES: hypothetical protein [Acidianus]EZQ12279.1 hypothetical protein CM19_00070 [Candidatus Acidianus copahuensis]NON61591.1 hypothetical protein [Acidianus sp. RZ1]